MSGGCVNNGLSEVLGWFQEGTRFVIFYYCIWLALVLQLGHGTLAGMERAFNGVAPHLYSARMHFTDLSMD